MVLKPFKIVDVASCPGEIPLKLDADYEALKQILSAKKFQGKMV